MVSIAFDSSGQVKQPSPEELAKTDQTKAILSYIHGTMDDGRPYWAYVAVRPSKYQEFYVLTVSMKPMVIGNYGTVVAAGFESTPPQEVVMEMREVYGFDDQFEAKLKTEALKQREALFDKQEAKRIDDIVGMLKKNPPNGSVQAKASDTTLSSSKSTITIPAVAKSQNTVAKPIVKTKGRRPTKRSLLSRIFGR